MVDYSLSKFMKDRLTHVSTSFHRYLYNQINWDSRLIGITGPRGIGKTTMVLQYIKENRNADEMLYVTSDHMYFTSHSLIETAEAFIRDGGKWICFDEVHKYPGWSRELKQLYDAYPELHVVFTGSSVLDINRGEADLSRRAVMYHMQGLSFREYLELFHGIHASIYSLPQILAGEVEIKGLDHPLPYFRKYLSDGYYPFAIEGEFNRKIMQIVDITVEVDIPQYADMKAATSRKIKQLLGTIAQSAPYKPNMDSLATEIKVSKNNLPDYLTWLERAGMIGQLRDDTSGMRGLGKVEKVFLDNPSLMSALGDGLSNIGTLRETFFYNQMRLNHNLRSSKIADFRIGDLTFEIGGKNKTQKQIAEAAKGYVVKDDIEMAIGNIIPIYHFGFNY